METFSTLLAICAGNSPVLDEFPAQRPVTRSCDVSLICSWIHGWVNNREAGDLGRYFVHYDVIIMQCWATWWRQFIDNTLDYIPIHFHKMLFKCICSLQYLISCIFIKWSCIAFPLYCIPLLEIKLHLTSIVLLGGFQSSPGALKSTK